MIRTYQATDRAQLIALWKLAFPNDPPHNEPSAVIDAKLKVDQLLFVAEADQQLVGAVMAGYDGHRGWLYSVAVHPRLRRRGVGTSLVRHAIEQLGRLGCVKVNLQVRATNSAVVAFYRSLGFSVEERISMGILLERSGA
jgi:ribosomal protein S18 acetylase RimI-like enzyme